VRRVVGSAFEPMDVRVVAATRRDLHAEMNAGRFRSDLFFRIAQVKVDVSGAQYTDLERDFARAYARD